MLLKDLRCSASISVINEMLYYSDSTVRSVHSVWAVDLFLLPTSTSLTTSGAKACIEKKQIVF